MQSVLAAGIAAGCRCLGALARERADWAKVEGPDPKARPFSSSSGSPRLAVLPTDVVNAADRRPVSDRAVRSAPVVVLEPVWQRGVAVSMRAVADSLRPFALHRLVEALDLAVRPRPV